MRIYIDQNILSVQAKSAVTLSLPGHEVVYSTIHFDEIRRSINVEPYLCALKRLKARLLEPVMRNGLPEDHVQIVDAPPKQLFEIYLQKRANYPIDTAQFSEILAWLSGGGSEESVASAPAKIHDFFIDSLSAHEAQLPKDLSRILADSLMKSVNSVVSKARAHGNDYRADWKRLGAEKNGFSNLFGKNQLLQIWDTVKDRVPDRSPEAFFGFEWKKNGNNVPAPQILGIVACCGVLDALGFQAEKKRRKVKNQANVQSDAQHIAMASFCDVLFTQDERLYRRAKAIYEFRRMQVNAIYLDQTGEPHL